MEEARESNQFFIKLGFFFPLPMLAKYLLTHESIGFTEKSIQFYSIFLLVGLTELLRLHKYGAKLRYNLPGWGGIKSGNKHYNSENNSVWM